MRNICNVFFLSVICMATSCFSPPPDKAMLNDTYLNKQSKDYNSVLLVFTGTAVDRTILENLGGELAKKLKKKNIAVTSEYFSDNIKKNNRLISEMKVDAVMVFTPLNGAKIKEYYGGVQGLETRQAKTSQRYDIRLYDEDENEKPVWGARLYLHITIDSKRRYSKIADKIVLHLYENAILKK
jgi:hypothetical protein